MIVDSRRGRPDQGRGHRAGARARPDRRHRRLVRDLEERRRWFAEGVVPVPRREVAVVQRHAVPWLLLLLRLPRGRRRHRLHPEGRPDHVLRSGRDAGLQGRHPAAVRGLRRAGAARTGEPAAAARRGAQGRGRVLRRPAVRRGRGLARAAVPGPARLRQGRGRAVRGRVLAARRRGAGQPPARSRLHERRAGRVRPGRRRAARAVRPVPRPADVADPGRVLGRDRVRCPPALRRRPDRSEVPEHPRDADLQEVQGPVRRGPGPPRDRQGPPGRRRRGVHRRDGVSPRGRADRGRHLRYVVRRRPRAGPAAAAAGPRPVPRRGDLHLRR